MGEIHDDAAQDQARARREERARDLLLAHGADRLSPRPWRPPPVPTSATDLTQYALWHAAELTREELLGALSLVSAARDEQEGVEAGLLFVARGEGLTWSEIADAMGFRSKQACQQHVDRLTARRGNRS
ncbi:MarR family transcriptional regulator [Gordonia sp. (in: high G+C Gram-positive bacteria)]|uniref:MarR family transcriptional regulator n=1 Tax=Gordonia sp. (in: high G+C Gram-positive bacteria) TaxID=84139 RepID=UPI0039E2E46C